MNIRVINALRKSASASGDFWRSLAGTGGAALTGIGAYPAAYANATGIATSVVPADEGKKAAINKLVDYDKSAKLSYVPGIGTHRLLRRKVLLNQLLAKDNVEHDSASKRKYQLLSYLNPLNVVSMPFAALAAAITDKRSLAEHKEVTDDPHYGLKSMLIPGWNTYNALKAIGASDRVSELHKLTDRDLKELDPEVVKELQRLIALKEQEQANKKANPGK